MHETNDDERPSIHLDDGVEIPGFLDPFGLWTRWPEPRVLEQTVVWISPDRTTVRLDQLGTDGLYSILRQLHDHVDAWYKIAVQDEFAALSSALAWTYKSLDVRMVAEMHPLIWMESTALVREIRASLEQNNPKAPKPTTEGETHAQ